MNGLNHCELRPTVLIGPDGRVGQVLQHLLERRHAAHVSSRQCIEPAVQGTVLVRRGDDLRATLASLPPSCPLVVATQTAVLPAVIAATPAERRGDLILLQNGMLLPLLHQYGLRPSTTTQALLYLAAHGDGTWTDGKQTVCTGPLAPFLCDLLSAGGVQCRQVAQDDYLALAVEKLLWSSIYWLLSSALGGLPVGRLADEHADKVAELAAELLPLAQAYLASCASGGGSGSCHAVPAGAYDGLVSACTGTDAGAGAGAGACDEQHSPGAAHVLLSLADVVGRLQAYSRSIPAAVPSQGMAMAEFEFRNGFFLAQRRTPRHAAWLRHAGIDA